MNFSLFSSFFVFLSELFWNSVNTGNTQTNSRLVPKKIAEFLFQSLHLSKINCIYISSVYVYTTTLRFDFVTYSQIHFTNEANDVMWGPSSVLHYYTKWKQLSITVNNIISYCAIADKYIYIEVYSFYIMWEPLRSSRSFYSISWVFFGQ